MAKDSLIDRYVGMINDGLPIGSLPPFRRWVKTLAEDLSIDQTVLMEEIRVAAMAKIKAQQAAG